MLLSFIGSLGGPELIMILIVIFFTSVFYVLPLWLICSKAGLNPALSLISIIPLGLFIVLFILALSNWPKLQDVRQQSGLAPPPVQ